MSSTESSGGQSFQVFLHWLKNTWLYKQLSKFCSWIVSCFRPKNKKTESQSASAKQEKNDGNNNDKSKSSEVELNEVSEPNIIENGKLGSVIGPSQTPVNPESPKMSRSSSEASLNRTALSGLPTNRLLRSQSLNDLSQASIDSELEWDDGYDSHLTFLQVGTQEHSSQPEQNLGSNDTEKEKDDDKDNNNPNPNPSLSRSSSSLPSSSSQKY